MNTILCYQHPLQPGVFQSEPLLHRLQRGLGRPQWSPAVQLSPRAARCQRARWCDIRCHPRKRTPNSLTKLLDPRRRASQAKGQWFWCLMIRKSSFNWESEISRNSRSLDLKTRPCQAPQTVLGQLNWVIPLRHVGTFKFVCFMMIAVSSKIYSCSHTCILYGICLTLSIWYIFSAHSDKQYSHGQNP